jgi:hypothetical protein
MVFIGKQSTKRARQDLGFDLGRRRRRRTKRRGRRRRGGEERRKNKEEKVEEEEEVEEEEVEEEEEKEEDINIYLLRSVHTGTRAYSASCPLETGSSSSRQKGIGKMCYVY